MKYKQSVFHRVESLTETEKNESNLDPSESLSMTKFCDSKSNVMVDHFEQNLAWMVVNFRFQYMKSLKQWDFLEWLWTGSSIEK